MAEEKIFTIPLRIEWLKVPRWRRTKRAAATVRAFVLRYAKAKDVKIGKWLNLALWEHGAKNPPGKVMVKVTKDKDVAKVELTELPPKAKRLAELEQTKVSAEKKRGDAKKSKDEQKKKEEDYKKKKDEEKKAIEQAKQYQTKVTKEQEIAMHR